MKTRFLESSRITLIILILMMIVGFVLRTFYLKNGNIIFGYDQARDAYISKQIAGGDLKILGPPVSFGNLYHGVIYYYLIAIPYYLSNGNPTSVIYFLAFLNILAIPIVYLTGKIFFNKKIGLLSSFFYVISFDVIQYSNWLSNPSLSVPFSTILFLGIALFISGHRKNLGIVLMAVGYALSFQSEFFLGYLLIPISFFVFFLKKYPNKKQFIYFVSITILILSSMIISYVKFGNNTVNGSRILFSDENQFSRQQIDFSSDFKMFFVRLTENFNRTIFPSKSLFTFIFVGFCFFFSFNQIRKKTKLADPLLILWVFLISQIIIIPFGGSDIPYLNAGFQLPVILISSTFIHDLLSRRYFKTGILLILFFSLLSFRVNFKYNPKTQILNDISPNMTLKNEIEVLEYTYTDSLGKPFSINTITNPYWINTLWSYLYQWYGQSKYQYTPTFHGRDQAGQLSYLSQNINTDTETYYLIIESSKGMPQYLIDDSIAYEDSFSNTIETKNFNGILVQKRQLTKPFNKINFVK